MSDMSTLAGQAGHYASVRLRLRMEAFEATRAKRPFPVKAIEEVPPDADTLPHIGVPINLLAPPSWKFIVRLVALKHQVTIDDILGRSRVKVIVRARHEAIYRVKLHFPHLSTVELGRRFGGIDHSSVIHALRKLDPTFSTVSTQSTKWRIDSKKNVDERAFRVPYAGKERSIQASKTGLYPHG